VICDPQRAPTWNDRSLYVQSICHIRARVCGARRRGRGLRVAGAWKSDALLGFHSAAHRWYRLAARILVAGNAKDRSHNRTRRRRRWRLIGPSGGEAFTRHATARGPQRAGSMRSPVSCYPPSGVARMRAQTAPRHYPSCSRRRLYPRRDSQAQTRAAL
jgi:hypothetical protein